MIRRVEAHEAPRVFDLMEKVYSSHSLLSQGLEAYEDLLQTKQYVSLGNFEGANLCAHAGYRVCGNFALINALATDPEHRGTGLGRAIFDARIEDIEATQQVDFIVGYSMMQHLWSQRLYSDEFKPIGLDIGYPDIYHRGDSHYNKGESANAEIVLCRRLRDCNEVPNITLAERHHKLANRILRTIGVTGRLHSGDDETATDAFLGFHPNAADGLFIPALLDGATHVDFSPLLTSNIERQTFVNTIKEHREGNLIS